MNKSFDSHDYYWRERALTKVWDTYDYYQQKVINGLKEFEIENVTYNQLYFNLLFEVDFQMESLYQNYDNEIGFSDSELRKDLMNTINSMCRLLHFLEFSRLKFEDNNLVDVLDKLKDTLYT